MKRDERIDLLFAAAAAAAAAAVDILCKRSAWLNLSYSTRSGDNRSISHLFSYTDSCQKHRNVLSSW